jgi:hypothetical protein
MALNTMCCTLSPQVGDDTAHQATDNLRAAAGGASGQGMQLLDERVNFQPIKCIDGP